MMKKETEVLRYRRSYCRWAISILFFGIATSAWAQYTTARLSGIVSDPSGAVVAGATVGVREVGTGYTQTTSSTSAGQYSFPSLPVGNYEISVSMAGYTSYVQRGIVLSLGQAASQNVQLKVGAVSQQVVVNANASLVTTDSPTVGQLIDQKEISELPLNGRDVQQLVFLAPGATNVTANYCAANCEGGVFPSEQYAKVNGGGANGVNYLLDGVDANDTYINTNVPFPNPDAIQEFNLITGNMSASFGNAIGGVVNVVTKSGTDHIHGDVFEFFQNSALDASNYFSGGVVNPLKQNQFGGSIGGPIVKNRLFYFGSYQGTRFRTVQNGQIASVPDAAERTGDFGDLCTNFGGAFVAGVCTGGSGTTQLVNPSTGGNYANNIVPVSPVATYFLNHIPLPNGPNDQLTFNGGPDVQNTNEYLAKLDFNFGKHHLSGHYFQMTYTDPVFVPPSNNLLELRGDAEHLTLKNISIVDIYTISPTFLLSSYFGYNSENGATLSSAPFSVADAGVNIAVPPNLGGGNSAVLNFTIGGDIYLPGPPFGNWDRGDQSLREIATWIKGKHEVQFGGEILRVRLPMGNQYQESGVFDFEGLSGSPLADFELGAVSTFTQGGGLYLNFTGYRESLFVQDSWKTTPRLLLTAGLRWDPFFPYTDSLGRVACFVPGAQSQRFPTAPVGMLFGGKNHDPGCPDSSIYNNAKNFGPRVGFAYRLTQDGNTSIRGGAGYYYEAPNTVSFEDVVGVPPFAPVLNLSSNQGSGTPWVSLSDPYGSQGAANIFPGNFGPVNPTAGTAIFPTSGISFNQIFDRHFRLPMVLSYNLTVERGFKQDWMLRAAYVGNNGHHLSGTGDQESGLLQLNPNINGQPAYPNYGSIASINSGVDSNYNAAQITLEKRMVHGFSFLTNFTWSKELDDFAPAGGSPFLTNSCTCGRYFDYGPSDDDISKTFKLNGEYLVPHIGLPKGISQVVNGWEFSGTLSWQTGFPFSIFSDMDNSGSGIFGDRADLAAGSVQQSVLSNGRSHAAEVQEWFNTSAFQQNAPGTFGDTGKNILRGPRFFDADLAAVKNAKLTERLSMEFRAEFFNAFNNVNFARPDGNLLDSTYGEITGMAGASSSNTYGTAQPRIIQFATKFLF
jgi:Carboxypeptidase regulatory-like domain/TonB-dependent Receptor Plug Domain